MTRPICFMAGLLAAIAPSALSAQGSTESEAIQQAVREVEAALLEALEDVDAEGAAPDKSIIEEAAIDDVFSRGCGDDQGQDRCDPDVQSTMRSYYGIERADTLLARRTAFYRAMLVDGYGRDVVAISFVREPGQSPYVDVRAASRRPSDEQQLRSPITLELWSRLGSLASNFDQALAREVSDDGDVVRICLHGWVTVAEVTTFATPHVSSTSRLNEDGVLVLDSQELVRPAGRLRSDTEGACADGLAMPFAFALANEALQALPQCSALDIEDFRNAAELLAACQRLGGDRLAAGRAYSVFKALDRMRYGSNEQDISRYFVSLEESEQRAFEADVEGAFVVYDVPHATSPSDATIEAWLFYIEGEDAEEPNEQASMTIQLHDYAGEFRILSWDVSPREPFDREAFE